MKSILLAATFVALAGAPFAGTVMAQEARQDFALVNRTGYELGKLYVAPSASDDWAEDVLGRDTLGNGERVAIKFHRANRTCRWDLKVVYTIDDTNAVWQGINLCEVERITIRYNKNTDTTSATFD
jgi:hypothetical protein